MRAGGVSRRYRPHLSGPANHRGPVFHGVACKNASMNARPARSDDYPWYDSVWLAQYARATRIIREVRPAALAGFIEAFRILRTRADFEPVRLARPFGDAELAEIRRVVDSLAPARLELHEARTFRRFVVHDHEVFNRLQRRAVPLVSEAVGEPVEASYNFLSLYASQGICPIHMDAPNAKWTLDLCVEQSVAWPIHFSTVQPWPEGPDEKWSDPHWDQEVKRSQRFTTHELAEGEAIVFSGSSQWHYRDAMPARSPRDRATLLFLHFIPAGTAELVQPRTWGRRFGIPELA